MSRFTEYHGTVPVLKDKKMFPEAVAKLAEYEDMEEQGMRMQKITDLAWKLCEDDGK